MNDFILISRREYGKQDEGLNLEYLEKWQQWFAVLEQQQLLTRQVQHMDLTGRISGRYNSVQTGPYLEINESIGGIIFIRAVDYQHAMNIASNCPVLEQGGSIEVRMAI